LVCLRHFPRLRCAISPLPFCRDDLQEKLTDIGTQLQTALQTLHARDAELATAQTALDESKKALKRARGDETRAVRKVEDVEKQRNELHTNFEQFKKKVRVLQSFRDLFVEGF
jgi:chromosome segregation ATPase